MKGCSRCHVLLDVSEFYPLDRSKDGLSYECRGCRSAYFEARRQRLMAREVIQIPDSATCSLCRETKPATDFFKCRSAPNGLAPRCKPCHIAKNLESRQRARAVE
jgi:hypothetical protein